MLIHCFNSYDLEYEQGTTAWYQSHHFVLIMQLYPDSFISTHGINLFSFDLGVFERHLNPIILYKADKL